MTETTSETLDWHERSLRGAQHASSTVLYIHQISRLELTTSCIISDLIVLYAGDGNARVHTHYSHIITLS